MAFKKGQSGNPGGRPKAVVEIRDLARQHGRAAFERIVGLMHSADERVALTASQEVLNRAYGKPPQPQTGEGGEGAILVHVISFAASDRASQ